MKNNKIKIKATFFMLIVAIMALNGCKDDEEVFEKTRLFRPVLNENLYSIENTIIVNMGKMKEALSYTLEVSRDTFRTVEFVIETDTSYVEIDKDLIGEELFWNTLYQVRATAHASDPQFDSKVSDLGNVRTQRFPTILNLPRPYDVTDIAAKLTWTLAGAPVTSTRVFAPDDLQLSNPLFEAQPVSEAGQASGETIVTGLSPSTSYQIAIYSGEELRGWVTYTTKAPDIDPEAPGVIDIREDEDPEAVANAVTAAPDGAIILVKRGVTYKLPSDDLNKSITIRAAYGFGEQKAKLYTTGNWDLADGANIDHIRFIDLELRGEDYSGDYIFNAQKDNVFVGEVLFENCEIGTVRGIMRIRNTVAVDYYKIVNCVVDSVGGYGLLTTDTNPADPPTAHVNNIVFQHSTFNKIQAGITSRNNSASILIDGCTFSNFVKSGNYIFRYRGGDGNNNVSNGVVIKNSIFGHGWDEGGEEAYAIKGMDGLQNTTIEIINSYSTADFSFSGNEIPGFPIGNYAGAQQDLWVDPANNDLSFKDSGFSGKFDSGDPRWRAQL